MHVSSYTRRFYLLLSIVVISLFVGLQPTFAAGGSAWDAAYYNNAFLSGSPVLVRQDGIIGFNWGSGSPADGIQADNFSVRWSTDTYFEAGTYRFTVLADDNVYLRIDHPAQPQIDTFSRRAIGQYVTTDVTLTAGMHHVQLDYQELTGDAYVALTWENLVPGTSGPVVSVPQTPVPQQTGSGPWTGQYYGNVDFYGSPLLVLGEGSPSHNWGAGSPGGSIPVDNFSARWTSVLNFATGTYQINVKADDGVRVYVDGILAINEWHASSGVNYTATLALAAGQHSFQVDYYEGGGLAFLDFSITPIGDRSAPPPVVSEPSTGLPTTGRVSIVRLNVRSEPNTTAAIVTKVRENRTYPVIGRNADSTWWQINVGGTIGWVFWRYLDVSNPQGVPVVSSSTGTPPSQAPTTGITATPYTNVNVRSAPSTSGAIIGRVPQNTRVTVVGRNAANTWWQVNDGQVTGWISSTYAPLQSGTDVNSIPVTG